MAQPEPGARIHDTDPFAVPAAERSPMRRLRGRLPAAVTLWTAYGAADRPAGLTVSSKILAVDGIAYDADRIRQAITNAKDGRPISLLVKNGDHFQTVAITYRGGLRYPRLERIAGVPDLLSEIYRPK